MLPSVPNLPLLASLVSQEPFSLPSLSLRLIASLLSSQGRPLRPPQCQAVAPAGFALTPCPDLADPLPFSGLGLRGDAPVHRGLLHKLCVPARSSGCGLVRRHAGAPAHHPGGAGVPPAVGTACPSRSPKICSRSFTQLSRDGRCTLTHVCTIACTLERIQNPLCPCLDSEDKIPPEAFAA